MQDLGTTLPVIIKNDSRLSVKYFSTQNFVESRIYLKKISTNNFSLKFSHNSNEDSVAIFD